MSVINFRLRRISGERKDVERNDGERRDVEVTSNFMITSVDKKKDKSIGDYLMIKFKFNVSYKPDLGNIEMEGSVWYQESDMESVIVEEDAKKIELKAESVRDISNTILRNSLIESVELAKKLHLPVPLRFPRVNVEPGQVKFPKAS